MASNTVAETCIENYKHSFRRDILRFVMNKNSKQKERDLETIHFGMGPKVVSFSAFLHPLYFVP